MSTTNSTTLLPAAFTLYHAYKLRTLPAPPPGRTRTELEAFQIIRNMWLNEPLHVRAHFEEEATMQSCRSYIPEQTRPKNGYSGNLNRLETSNPPPYH
ncbi:hypothetical protein E4T56_gene14655 [Termitomyces sp. T112]|nr:hypothetical protein E4T56_gene14655 [Termitomyces sp. T112]KAH0582224.1 hypothetical protein H2248_011869 [Termitomyces sp. 'cryptogamus']